MSYWVRSDDTNVIVDLAKASSIKLGQPGETTEVRMPGGDVMHVSTEDACAYILRLRPDEVSDGVSRGVERCAKQTQSPTMDDLVMARVVASRTR